MTRGFAVLMIAFGATLAYAGYSDNTIADVLGSLGGRTPTGAQLSTKGKLNTGSAGLDRILIFVTEYFAVKLGGSIASTVGGAGAVAAA